METFKTVQSRHAKARGDEVRRRSLLSSSSLSSSSQRLSQGGGKDGSH